MPAPEGGHGDPSIVQLRALIRLSQGSYRAAAETRAERAALWQAIDRLEVYVNQSRSSTLELVERGGGGLTDNGAALLKPASDVLRAIDVFKGALTDLVNRPAHIRIACLPAQARIVAKAAKVLLGENSAVEAHLVEMDDTFRADSGMKLIDEVRNGTIDISVVPRRNDLDDLLSASLYSWHLTAVSRREDWRSRQGEPVELSDIGALGLLVSPPHHITRDLLDACEVDLDILLESSSVDAILAMALEGMGVGVVADDTLAIQGATQSMRRWMRLVHHRGQPLGGSTVAYSRHSSSRVPSVQRVIQELVRQSSEVFGTEELAWNAT